MSDKTLSPPRKAFKLKYVWQDSKSLRQGAYKNILGYTSTKSLRLDFKLSLSEQTSVEFLRRNFNFKPVRRDFKSFMREFKSKYTW